MPAGYAADGTQVKKIRTGKAYASFDVLSSGSRFLTGKQVRRPYLRRYGESLWKNRAALLLSGG